MNEDEHKFLGGYYSAIGIGLIAIGASELIGNSWATIIIGFGFLLFAVVKYKFIS